MNGFDLFGNSNKHVEKITPYPTEEERLEEERLEKERNESIQVYTEFGIRRRVSKPDESFEQAWERVRKLKWVRKNLKPETVKKLYNATNVGLYL